MLKREHVYHLARRLLVVPFNNHKHTINAQQGRIMEYLIAVTLLAIIFSVLVCWAFGLT